MNFYLFSLLIAFFTPLISGATTIQDNDTSTPSSSLSDNVVDCAVQTLVADIDNNEQEQSYYECMTYPEEEEDGAEYMAYALPDWIITKFRSAFESQPTTYLRIHGARLSRSSPMLFEQQEQEGASKNSNSLRGGSTTTTSPTTTTTVLEESTIIADEATATVEFSNGPFEMTGGLSGDWERRHLASSTGTSNVLMVRVTTNDGVPLVNADALSERAFGSDGTIKSTFEGCSFGKLQIRPATGSAAITNGVTDISINTNIVGVNIHSLHNTMMNALQAKVETGLQTFDHIAFCLPLGSTFGPGGSSTWVAFAFIEGTRSFYNGENCGQLSKLVHEVGHNLGLGHSGKEGQSAYADKSSIMGYGYSHVGFPIQCFNAAKNWQLGWYDDKSETVNVEFGAWSGRLYGYVDYANSRASTVLLKVGNDIFIQYNKIGSINRDTMEKRNQVTIVRSSSGTTANAYSDSLAGLDMDTKVYEIPRYVGNKALIIELCDRLEGAAVMDFFDLSIRLDDQPANCGRFGYLTQPTPSPTNRPTMAPTNRPTITAALFTTATLPPTPSPTAAEVIIVTSSPTKMMEMAPDPTAAPTNTPTPAPTKSPTPAPVPDPSMAPSQSPSQSPSNTPTSLDSASPTLSIAPSSLPTVDGICDDQRHTTFPTDEVNGEKKCIWLAARPDFQKQLCVPSHPAYRICEETCGACTDDCDDSLDGTFKHRGVDRPCSWLSIRFNVQNMVCVEGHDAMNVCPETCGSCDRR